jgi:NADH:ubiquinone oxidoreductase subunit E
MALHCVQKELGFVPPDARREIAEILGIPQLWIDEIVSFYPMLYETPRGRVHVQVCVTLSCALLGSGNLVARLRERYGIADGDATVDGRFSLQEVQCLASCGTAPAVLLDGERYENVTPDDLVRLMEERTPGATGERLGGSGISAAAAHCAFAASAAGEGAASRTGSARGAPDRPAGPASREDRP